MRRAFLSHNTADDRYVAELESFFRAAGLDVFNDVSSIQPDEKFWPKIQQCIAESDALVVVITAALKTSTWVPREVEYARSLSKKVIPLWVEDCPLPSIFTDRDVIDLRPERRELRHADISRITKYAPAELVGRDDEKKLLSDAWAKALRAENGRPQVLTFVALGGEGKTSLVAKWAVDEMSAKGWPGCDAAFAWSFYSQGTREQLAASSDLFLKEALTFFGDDADKAFAASPAGAFEKGQRLARLVGQRRSLLILDGLEPLQYAPTAPTPGELKDQGIAALLKGLAAASRGLCLVTTRYSLPDLRAFWQTTAPEVKLLRLSRDAGVHLLKTLGVTGTTQEFATLVEDVKGHALTLNLLGTYLRDAHAGDIRKVKLVKLEEADAEEQGGHAFHVMAAYEREFKREGAKGKRALAILRLLGLFDRPATADCLGVLWSGDAIPGLTEPLVGLSDAQRNLALKRLEDAKLLTVNRDAAGALVSLDAHPLLREYFAGQLRAQQPDAWRTAHRRLYEHLRDSTGYQPDTLDGLQPLFQAVAHGCQAGLYGETLATVYWDRISRQKSFFNTRKLGATGTDLALLSNFFEVPWSQPVTALKEDDKAFVLGETAVDLRSLGRLSDAWAPCKAGLETDVKRHEWKFAAVSAGNLSELALSLGRVTAALEYAQESIRFADRSSDWKQQLLQRAVLADALHQAGRVSEAEHLFREAERGQREREPEHPFIFSGRGFRFCDLLLSQGLFNQVRERVAITIQIAERNSWLLAKALDQLSLGRAALLQAQVEGVGTLPEAKRRLDEAVQGLRDAGEQPEVPRALLTRAWLRFLTRACTGPESAQEDLDEAWAIAERGPMKLFLADIHLHRARLFFREEPYPWKSPQDDLSAAEKLINACDYHRRDEELADAKSAILGIFKTPAQTKS